MKKLFLVPFIAISILTACQNNPSGTTVVMQPPPPPTEDTLVSDTNVAPPPPIENDKDVIDFVGMQNQPTYPGGIAEFYKFLGKNIKYPIQAAEANLQGNVFVSFIVSKDGNITDIKVDRKLGMGTDEEALRVLKLSKKWNPGIVDGKPVNVKYKMPIRFTLAK